MYRKGADKMNRSTVFIISTGDMFKEKTDAYVNPVNCVGRMGKGIALQFKIKFPDMYLCYKTICLQRKLFTGQIYVWKNEENSTPKYIFCFPTKIHFQNPSNYKYISEGMKTLRLKITEYGISSIAIPALGCGLGGLNFNRVLDIVQNELYDLNNLKVYIYQPKEKNFFLENA